MEMNSRNSCQPAWRKSSHSASTNCVEVATTRAEILVRDTKRPHQVVLRYPAASWLEFIDAIKAGRFDRSDR
jgi:hypothetical protein